MKTWQFITIIVIVLIPICALIYIYERKPTSLQEINWPIMNEWQARYGAGAQSQRDYDLWVLGQHAQGQRVLNAKFVEAFNAIDPNLLKDPNE